jgi:hypothetical protein
MIRFRDTLFEVVRYLLYGKKHSFWIGEFEWEERDKNGNVIDKWTSFNALVNDGELNILDSYFRSENIPISLYLMLVYNGGFPPAITDNLSDITGEPTIGVNGYQRIHLAKNTTDWPDLALCLGHGQVTSKQVMFEAVGGSWGPVKYAVLTTVPTGTDGFFIAYVPLSTTKTLSDGNTLYCRIRIRLR